MNQSFAHGSASCLLNRKMRISVTIQSEEAIDLPFLAPRTGRGRTQVGV